MSGIGKLMSVQTPERNERVSYAHKEMTKKAEKCSLRKAHFQRAKKNKQGKTPKINEERQREEKTIIVN